MKHAFEHYRSLLRNSGFNLGGQAINVIAALVCVPIAFRHMGPERFGLLSLMWTMLSNTILFDLGTGPAVARATAASLATDKGTRIRAIVKAGVVMQILIGICAGLLVVTLASPILHLMKVPADLFADAHVALIALALAIPVVLVVQSQQAVLEGLERFDLINYVRTPMAVATFAIPAIGALAGWRLGTMIIGIVATRVFAVLILFALYRGRLPANQTGSIRSELSGLFRYGRWLAVSGALTQSLLYLDRFLIGAMRGLSAVGQYAAPYDAAAKLLVLPGSIGVAMFPGLAKDVARGEVRAGAERARVVGRMIMMIVIPICVVLIALAGPILHLWLGPQLSDAGVTAFRILMVATLFHAAAYAPVIFIEAAGRSDVVARYYLLELPVYVAVLWAAIARFGVAGAAWAWVAHWAGVLVWSTWYARRFARRAPVVVNEYAHAD